MQKCIPLILLITVVFHSGLAQLSQTRTATFLNNFGQFQEFFGDQNYPRANAESLTADDNIYARSSRLGAIKDSASSFRFRSVSSLSLQGFGFTIPSEATIQNISIRVKRFKTGTPSIGDHILSLMQRYQCGGPTEPCRYGKFWTYLDTYDGKIYPSVETEYVFPQTGNGNDGGFNHDEAFQWTPTIVNQPTFGVRVDNFPPIGKGVVVLNYDLVEVTVDYTLTEASSSHLEMEINTLKKPIVYPNPFTSVTKMQFIAAETGSAVVELYNVLGAKMRTLYSGRVIHGQAYVVPIGDGRLAKGMYFYRILNGQHKYAGRLLKVE